LKINAFQGRSESASESGRAIEEVVSRYIRKADPDPTTIIRAAREIYGCSPNGDYRMPCLSQHKRIGNPMSFFLCEFKDFNYT
jgi:hypothetical protein